MSRGSRFRRSLFSGYFLLGAQILYSFGSVPLALHYLSKAEFGLWALVMQISGYLQLVDLGMSGSIARILVDHKDDPEKSDYGSTIKTGTLVLAAQGLIVAVAGAGLSYWFPGLFGVPEVNRRDFQLLIAGQCVVMGLLFVARMPKFILEAHQRYDTSCYAQVGALVVNLGVMWFGFSRGWGLYSLLAGYAASLLLSAAVTFVAVDRLKLLPPTGSWGRANRKTFNELFSFGREIFLLSIGYQLISASQVMVISRTLGLEAAAVWSIATKPFTLAQQVVSRLLDFSSSALAEMMVRKERERLLLRFQDLVVLTCSVAIGISMAVALCNPSFLAVLTHGRISWDRSTDWWMALMIILTSTTRCYIGFTGVTKDIRGMKWVYFVQGLVFVGSSLLVAPVWGMNGIIVCALITDFLCSGVYGFWRTRKYFQVDGKSMLGWLRWSTVYLILLAVIFVPLSLWKTDWSPLVTLITQGTIAGVIAVALFWLGLSPHLRSEARAFLGRLRGRLRPAASQADPPRMKV